MMKQLVDSAFATELLRVGQEWLKRNDKEKGGRRLSAWRGGKRPSRPFVHVQRAHVKERNATREQEAAQGRSISHFAIASTSSNTSPRGQPAPLIIRTRQSTALIAWANSSSGLHWWRCHQR